MLDQILDLWPLWSQLGLILLINLLYFLTIVIQDRRATRKWRREYQGR